MAHFEFSDPETKFARRTGSVKADAEIEYAIKLDGISESDTVNVDNEHRTFSIRLELPQLHKPRVEGIEYKDISNDGVLGLWTLGLFGSDQRFKDEAGQRVKLGFDKRLNDRSDLAKAQNEAKTLLNALFKGTGWKCDIEWKPEASP